jgi:hypothetical protein
MLVNPDEEEIRWKYSALQIEIGDIELLKDDFDYIISVNESRSFIPYENISEINYK